MRVVLATNLFAISGLAQVLTTPATALDLSLSRLHSSRDYILPPPLSARVAAAEVTDGSVVSYRAFDGTIYPSLVQYNGRFVAFLLPATSISQGRYSLSRLRSMIDRLDLLYAHFRDFMGAEPVGEGLLHIAFVKTCGLGCGHLGSKGIELIPEMLDPTNTDYPDDAPYIVGIHEMAHNFDFYSPHIMFGGDYAHSWTAFLQSYMVFYNREGGLWERGRFYATPERFLQLTTELFFEPYLAFPGGTWERCVRDNQCINGMNATAQGGLVARVAELHSAAAMRNFVAYLADAIKVRKVQPAQQSILQKNDLLIESLAFGVGANISCYVDEWRWPITPALRSQLSQLPPSPRCSDGDGDGLSAAQGDLDDADRNIQRHLDGSVIIAEPGDFPSSNLPTVQDIPSLPVRIRGTIVDDQDVDGFRINLSEPTRLLFRLSSTGTFSGWIFLYERSGGWRSYVAPGTHAYLSAELPAGQWRFDVALNINSSAGSYQLSVETSPPGLTPDAPDAPPPPGEQATSRFLTAYPNPSPQPGDTLRFWVSGTGFLSNFTSTFSIPTPPDCAYSYRYQYLRAGVPLTAVSNPTFFAASSTPCAVPDQLVNSASLLHGPIAPGEIATIFGQRVGPATPETFAVGVDGKVATTLGQTRIWVDGIAAPLLYVSSPQTNFVVPYSIAGKSTATVQVEYQGVRSAPFTANVTNASPAAFSWDGRRAIVHNEGFVLNGPLNAAARGSAITIYATGEGSTDPAGIDGLLANNILPKPLLPVSVTIGGQPANVLYAGALPTAVAGALQINVRIPTSAPVGSAIPLIIKIGDKTSPALTVSIR